MPLTANRDVDRYVEQNLRSVPIAASKHVYKGGLVGSASGYAQPLVAGNPFIGLAYKEIDNSSGANGDKSVTFYTLGDFAHALSGAVLADLGRPVFASSDDTLTFSADGNSYVGIVQEVPAAGSIILRLDTQRRLVKTITHTVEDLAANADIAARAIHSFEKEGWITGARVTNQATAASGIDGSNTCVVTLAIDAGTVVAETFDATTTFPAANAQQSLGALANEHAAAGDILTLAVTNGTTSDPGPFLIEVDYV